MKSRHLTYCLVILSLILSIMLLPCPAFFPKVLFAKEAPIELRFAYTMLPKYPPTDAWEKYFGEELEKRTNGRVKVIFYPAESLFKAAESYDSVVSGIGEITNLSVKQEARRMPLTGVTLLPNIIFPDTVVGTVAAAKAVMTLYKEFPEIQAEFKDVKLLWFSTLNNSVLHSKKQIRVPKDLKGLKIGASGLQGEMIKLAGGSPVNIAGPDTYMSLKTAVIDGQLGSWSLCYGYKLYEVTKYHLDYGLGRVPFPMIMNKAKWDSLPADIQNLILELAEQQLKPGAVSQVEKVNEGLKATKDYGGTTIQPTAKERALWVALGGPIEKKWVADMKAAGASNADKILNRFKDLAKQSWK